MSSRREMETFTFNVKKYPNLTRDLIDEFLDDCGMMDNRSITEELIVFKCTVTFTTRVNSIREKGCEFFGDGNFQLLKIKNSNYEKNFNPEHYERFQSGELSLNWSITRLQSELHGLIESQLTQENRDFFMEKFGEYISEENPVEDLKSILDDIDTSKFDEQIHVDELAKQVDDLLDSDSDQPEQLHYQGLVKYIDDLDDSQKEIVEDILKKSKNKEDQNRNYLTNTNQKSVLHRHQGQTKYYKGDGSKQLDRNSEDVLHDEW
jgi:hypothetical protein